MNLKATLRRWGNELSPSFRSERDALVAGLQHDQSRRRQQAAQLLGTADPGNKGITALIAGLHDPDFFVSWEAARSLAQINTPLAWQALLKAMSDDSPQTQVSAIDASTLLPPDADIRRRLLAAATNPHREVRQAAAQALAGQDPADALPAVVELLSTDPDPLVRRAAALALGTMGKEAARELLTSRQGDANEHPLVREAARLALGQLAPSP